MLTFGKGLEPYEKKDSSKISKSLSEYHIEGIIGEGNFGKVKYATHIKNNLQLSIKFINVLQFYTLQYLSDTQAVTEPGF